MLGRSMAIDISILIVTYECREAARDCLTSVYEGTTGLDYEVVVVDNASGDGTAAMVRTDFPRARLVAIEANVGFAAGVNLAAEAAVGEYVLLLNPDTVVHEGAVENLASFARRHPEHAPVAGAPGWTRGVMFGARARRGCADTRKRPRPLPAIEHPRRRCNCLVASLVPV